MNDLISVLMCVYNTPVLYLREAVMSIIGQSYNNLEFVIVDDSSDDGDVIDYLEELACDDNRVKLIHNKENSGLTRALNIGLKQCHGKYIARMDSDDISLANRLIIQYDYMEKNRDVALVGSNIISFGEGLEEKDETGTDDAFDDPEGYRIRSLMQHSGPAHPTFMFRREFLEKNGIEYREDILKAQDYGIMCDILLAGGIIRKIRAPLLKYRIHSGQITNTAEIEQKAYQCRVSYDNFKKVFPDLDGEECAALSLLGCDYEYDDLLRAVKRNKKLSETCGFLISNKDRCGDYNNYIKAIKKVIILNKRNGKYNSGSFNIELRSKWWKKALRTSIQLKSPWGMKPFTLFSYMFAWRLEHNKK